MTYRYPEHPYRDAFTALLRDLYREYGVTSLAELVEMCERLSQLYPEFYPDEKAPKYVKSTFGNLLNGRLPGLPSPRLVRAYFLCCLAIGRPDLEPAAVRAQLRRVLKTLQRFADEAHANGLFVWRGYRPESGSRSVEQTWFRAAHSRVPRDLEPTASVALTGGQREVIEGYRPYGLTLLRRVRQNDPHALYQCALLLAVRTDENEKITELLFAAGAVEHQEALELLEADPNGINRFAARDHASHLAARAEQTDHAGAAEAFSRCVELLEDLTRPEPFESTDHQTQESPP